MKYPAWLNKFSPLGKMDLSGEWLEKTNTALLPSFYGNKIFKALEEAQVFENDTKFLSLNGDFELAGEDDIEEHNVLLVSNDSEVFVYFNTYFYATNDSDYKVCESDVKQIEAFVRC